MGLVKDGTASELVVQEKNYLVKHIVDYNDRHKWEATIGPVEQISTSWHCVRQLYPPGFRLLLLLGTESESTTLSQYADGQTATRTTTIDDLHGLGGTEHCGKSRKRIFTYRGCRAIPTISLIPGKGCIFLLARPSLTALR